MMNDQDRDSYKHQARIISGLWEFVITNGAQPEKDRGALSRAFDDWGFNNPQKVPHIIHRDHLGKFVFLVAEH